MSGAGVGCVQRVSRIGFDNSTDENALASRSSLSHAAGVGSDEEQVERGTDWPRSVEEEK